MRVPDELDVPIATRRRAAICCPAEMHIGNAKPCTGNGDGYKQEAPEESQVRVGEPNCCEYGVGVTPVYVRVCVNRGSRGPRGRG